MKKKDQYKPSREALRIVHYLRFMGYQVVAQDIELGFHWDTKLDATEGARREDGKKGKGYRLL
jgi:hypothetical protein